MMNLQSNLLHLNATEKFRLVYHLERSMCMTGGEDN